MTVLSILKDKKDKPRKKSRKRYLIGQIDKIVSLMVRKRDNFQCRHCGRSRGTDQGQNGAVAHHHIFTKQRFTTRWDLSNGISLCYHCHRWAHAAAEEFRSWVISWMGEKEYRSLYLKSQMRGGFKECDLELLLEDMRETA